MGARHCDPAWKSAVGGRESPHSSFSRSFLARLCLESSAIPPASGREGADGTAAPGKRGGICGARQGGGLGACSASSSFLASCSTLWVLPLRYKGQAEVPTDTDPSPHPPASQVLESRLQRPLPEDLAEALANGVILCQLANQLRPRSVPFIHVPSPAVVSWVPGQEVGDGTEDCRGLSLTLFSFSFLALPQPKLSALKSRKNVESFLEACRKMGVPEVWGVCSREPRASPYYKER